MKRVEFSVLGPLDVRSGGHAIDIGGPKQRALLAVLLLSANRVVSRERLIEELWPGNGAAAAEKTLNVSIARLRTKLAGARNAGGATDHASPRIPPACRTRRA